MFPGIVDRMQRELTALSPSSVKVCISLHCSFPKLAIFDLRTDDFLIG